LAQELDAGAASLYVYVRNTAELHAAILEQLLRQVDLSPVTAAGDWRDRLITVLWSYTSILFGQPGLAQSGPTTRPSGPAYLSLAEGLLALLSAGGVPQIAALGAELMSGAGPDRLIWGFRVMISGITQTPRPEEPEPRVSPEPPGA